MPQSWGNKPPLNQALLADERTAAVPDTPAAPEDETFVDYRPLAARGESLRTPTIPGYEVLERLARGGMGVVYKARHLRLKRVVALKMILSAEHAGPHELARFRQEAEAAARLQHPGIVQVFEVGEHDGRPWIAQEFVAGGSLAERLDGAPQSPRDAARLVRTLAEAIAHAHAQGVVHRDLKPANVLLTKSGQLSAFSRQPEEEEETVELPRQSTIDEVTIVADGDRLAESCGQKADGSSPMAESFGLIADGFPKIADFGLAKRLDAEGSSAGLTRTGDVMGTPSYMAPEQAAGEGAAIGPLADVYALGAILYELLAGRPPFRGATALETLDQLRTQEPLPPSRLLPRLPRDIETICLKSLQKDPAKRYGSAQALADDLGRFVEDRPILARPVGRLERSWRWCRRNPAVAGLTALAASLLIAVATVSVILAIQSDNALRDSRRAAKDLADERDAKQREAQAAIGARDRAREVIEALSSEDALDQLSRQKSLTPQQRNFLERMVVYYREYATETAASEPELVRQQRAYFNMGRIHMMLGRPSESADAYVQAIRVLDQLCADHPANPQYVADRAFCFKEKGMLASMIREFDVAEVDFERALADFGQLTSQHPEQPEHEYEVARVEKLVGNLRGLQRRAAEALQSYEAAGARLKRLAQEHPRRHDYWSSLAGVLDAMSWLYSEIGEPAKGRQSTLAALDVYKKLVELNPRDLDFQFFLATAHGRLGQFLDDLGDPRAAAPELQAAAVIFSRLVLEQPGMPDFAANFGQTQHRLGSVLEQFGDFTRARQAFEAAIRIQDRLSREYPELADYARDLALTHKSLGDFLRSRGDRQAAQAAYEAALSVQSELAAAHPDDPPYVKHLPLIQRRLADLLHGQGELAAARKLYEEARTGLERLVQLSPDDDDHSYDLATTCSSLGTVLSDMEDWPAALQAHQAALELREGFLKAQPEDAAYQLDLGGTYCNLANVLRDSGQGEDAVAAYQKAITTLEPLVAALPDSPLPGRFLRIAHWGRARTYHQLKRHADADRDWDRAMELDDSQPDDFYRLQRALHLAQAGEFDLALKTADDWATKQNVAPEDCFSLARLHALAASAPASGGSDSAGSSEQQSNHADRAMEYLRQAKERGFFENPARAARLKTLADLAALRERADFKELLSAVCPAPAEK